MNLPKRRKPQPLGVREAPQIRNASHLKWIRGHECSVAGRRTPCEGDIEAAHVRTGTDGGLSVKPSDCWTIPLCSFHHQIQHTWGEDRFEKAHNISMRFIAEQLYAKSPHRKKDPRP